METFLALLFGRPVLTYYLRGVAALVILFLVGCVPAMYRVADVDSSLIRSVSSPSQSGCLKIDWGGGVVPGEQASTQYGGGPQESVRVDLRNVISSVGRRFYSDGRRCEGEPYATITITKAYHKHYIAPDVGVYFVTAGIRVVAEGICRNNGRRISRSFESDRHHVKAGFAPSAERIDWALARATTQAAAEVLSFVLDECR